MQGFVIVITTINCAHIPLPYCSLYKSTKFIDFNGGLRFFALCKILDWNFLG